MVDETGMEARRANVVGVLETGGAASVSLDMKEKGGRLERRAEKGGGEAGPAMTVGQAVTAGEGDENRLSLPV